MNEIACEVAAWVADHADRERGPAPPLDRRAAFALEASGLGLTAFAHRGDAAALAMIALSAADVAADPAVGDDDLDRSCRMLACLVHDDVLGALDLCRQLVASDEGADVLGAVVGGLFRLLDGSGVLVRHTRAPGCRCPSP